MYTTGGVDYVDGPYNVTFSANTKRAQFDVFIIGDNVLERNEQFQLNIIPTSLPDRVTISDPSKATVTIKDDDSELKRLLFNWKWCCLDITITFNQSTYRVNEDDGPAQPVLVLSNPSSTDITVQVNDTNGPAAGKWSNIIKKWCSYDNIAGGGADYVSGPYTVIFPVGVISVSFNASINDDNVLEDNESFTLTIIESSLPDGVTIGGTAQATVTILDTDGLYDYMRM